MAEFDIQKVRGLCKYVTPDIDGEGNRTIIIPFDGFDLDFIAASRELLLAACDEIERLRDEQEECANSCTLVRDYSKELEQLRADAKNWQCEFPCSEEKWCNRQNLCSEMKSLTAKIDRGRIAYHAQVKRIQELEGALIVTKAEALCYASIGRTPVEANESGCNAYQEFKEMPERWQAKFLVDSKEQLRAEGKL